MATVLALAAVAVGVTVHASSPKFFQVATQVDFLKGDLDGLAIDSRGQLTIGAASELVYETAAPFLWSMVSTADGSIFVGTGNEGKVFRVDGDGMWAAVGGDRPERPLLRVDADVIYFHATGGVKIAKELYAIGGFRRLALKYDVQIGEFPSFERKPGFWDPVVGIAWHREGEDHRLEVHAVFEGGGFGAGTDVEWSGMLRLDFKPIEHFGITAGYNLLYFKGEDTVGNRTFKVEQTLHGPLAGIGFYF